ncbi:MAG: capsular polysaccharide biosynthesis protein [Pseudomonadota bacterium]
MTFGTPGSGLRPDPAPARLTVQTLGFWRARRVRRMLELAGWRPAFGWPGQGDWVGVWGQRPVSARGRWIAWQTGSRVLTIEDGFLRSIYPGSQGAPPISIVLDDLGIYYDGRVPSRLEQMIEAGEWDDETLARATAGIARLRAAGLSKYSPPATETPPKPGFVLVVDQTAGDASIVGAGTSAETFSRMLDAARVEHPGKTIVIKTHPEVAAGTKTGHDLPSAARSGEVMLIGSVASWDLLDAAEAVYTVSSQLGYDALLAGKPVRTFGAAFYAGWGLTEDESLIPRRTARPDIRALFAACHLAYPIYYDPWRDRLCAFETAVDVLSAQRRSETPEPGTTGDVLHGIRLWKRGNVASFRPRHGTPVRFEDDAARAATQARDNKRALWAWASRVPEDWLETQKAEGLTAGLIEDGFLRSVGLGAELTVSASLVFDRQGIYFDPSRPSDLETLIAEAAKGSADLPRARALREAIIAARVTKYNTGAAPETPDTGARRVILVPGQVEDDASILRGCGHGEADVRTNFGLLAAARQANPDAWLIYKSHPDVEAGLRAGAVPHNTVRDLADEVATGASAADLLDRAEALWTMTSLMGFEALVRGVPVTCLGTPFYAGWGLTQDLGPPCPRRTARPSLDALIWAALIAYPRYVDPVSGLPCTPEVIVERLGTGAAMPRARVLSKVQGLLAGQSWLWRGR